ncbi:MAG: PhzF family phenazine biosynthesis protein [Bryobacterales bacterium]|nr:PhzF family phenazine biosynthesis protein [Bryobacterales bacterium]
MRIPIVAVDAFTGRVFAGNLAAVCPLPWWLEDGRLQAIAAENNLPKTLDDHPCRRDRAHGRISPPPPRRAVSGGYDLAPRLRISGRLCR